MFANRVRIILSVLILVCLMFGIFPTHLQQVEAGVIRVTITDNYYLCIRDDNLVCADKNWVTEDYYEPWWHKYNPFHESHNTSYVYRTQSTVDEVESCSDCDS